MANTISILYPWVQSLGLRYQGTLLAAIRGGDGIPKEHPSKSIQRAIRWVCLVPFDVRETAVKGGFMSFDLEEMEPAIKALRKELDQLNIHYVFHVMHALEVVGYEHPEAQVRETFFYAYSSMVKKLHLNVETREQLRDRMTEDRIANDSVTA